MSTKDEKTALPGIIEWSDPMTAECRTGVDSKFSFLTSISIPKYKWPDFFFKDVEQFQISLIYVAT